MSTTVSAAELRRRCSGWAMAYGGEQYARLGFSGLAYIGMPPANDAAGTVDAAAEARQVELIVEAMEESGRWKEARVLRVEYFLSALPEPTRLGRLKRFGLPMSRTTYYTYLGAAHAFLAGALAMKAG